VALQQYFSHPRLVIYFFPTSPIKETVTAKGVRILMAIHMEQSNHLANQQQVLSFVVSFASLSILCKPKP
jgi:hypothetical protein